MIGYLLHTFLRLILSMLYHFLFKTRNSQLVPSTKYFICVFLSDIVQYLSYFICNYTSMLLLLCGPQIYLYKWFYFIRSILYMSICVNKFEFNSGLC